MSACVLVIAQEADSILENAMEEVLDLSPLNSKLNSTSRKSFLQLSYISVSMHNSSKFHKYSHLK